MKLTPTLTPSHTKYTDDCPLRTVPPSSPPFRIQPSLIIKAMSYTVGFRRSKTALFDRTFFRLDSSGPSSCRQASRFYSFRALPRGGWCEGVLMHGSQKSVGGSVLTRVLRDQRVLHARRTFVQAGWCSAMPKAAKATFVALHSAESRQSYSRRSRCWQNGIDNARYCWRVIHAAGERS